MKKTFNPVSDVRNESIEGSKRLYRAITDIARSLDESRDRAQTCTELFLSNVEAQREKLRDFCEKLIFTDPLGHGRKGEELLWRKGYYDVVTTAKRLRKNNTWHEDEAALVQSHLWAGLGHYHHMIFRLQAECKLDLRGIIDFPLMVNDGGLTKGKKSSRGGHDGQGVEWAWQTIHRCLVCLGDLSRYFLDIQPQWDSGLPQRYYLQAVSLNADIGMPHNQLGTLSGSQNYSVDAAYYYMRCLSCTQSFEGAEGNLRRIFEKNNKWLENQNRWNIDDKLEDMPPTERIHRFIARFFILVDVWFFDKMFPANPNQLCQLMVEDLRHCLLYTKQFPSDSQLSPELLDLEDLLQMNGRQETENPEYLKDELVFELVAMLLLCINRLKVKRSKLLPGLVTFTVAFLSELIQQIVDHIQDSVLSVPIPSLSYIASSPHETNISIPTSNGLSVAESSSSTPESQPDISASKMINGSDQTPDPQENGYASVNGKDTESKEDKKKKKKKMKYLNKFRRRKPLALGHNSSEESDYSDGELPSDSSCSSDEGNEDICETDEHINLSFDDYDDEDIDDDSDVSSTSTQVESKEVALDSKEEKIANGDCSGNVTPDTIQKEVLLNGVIAEDIGVGEMVNGVSGENTKVDVPNLEANKSAALPSFEESPCGKKNEVLRRPADPVDVMELVAEEGLLQAVKVCCDWLLGEREVLKVCARSSPTFFSRLASLLNLIDVDAELLEKSKENASFFKLRNVGELFKKVPLTEDVKLKGIFLLREAHSAIDWEFCRNYYLHSKEEALLRVYKLVSFGKFVASIDDGQIMCYNELQRVFTISTAALETVEKDSVHTNGFEERGGGGVAEGARREAAMRNMGQLWLRAQVRELEVRVRAQRRLPGGALPPYVAVDCAALTAHLPLVRHLAAARRFIVLVPAVVVSALDELKREVGRAREAIRWLEAQFERGNRFVRAQRSHERLPLPLIRYPRKKERSAWFFFQVVECCHYFARQGGTQEAADAPLVTLLTGTPLPSPAAPAPPDERAYSPVGVASAAGINLEYIEAFVAKWKASSKSAG